MPNGQFGLTRDTSLLTCVDEYHPRPLYYQIENK
jgi:hypothetical protein